MTSAAQVGTAWADPVANSYRLKTMPTLTGYGPDGGYDIYGRLVAKFLPKHLPGVSAIFAQNMPSGVGFVSAKYMNKALPQDGTVLGSLAQKLALDSAPAQGRKAGGTIAVARFSYIGHVVTKIDTDVAPPVFSKRGMSLERPDLGDAWNVIRCRRGQRMGAQVLKVHLHWSKAVRLWAKAPGGGQPAALSTDRCRCASAHRPHAHSLPGAQRPAPPAAALTCGPFALGSAGARRHLFEQRSACLIEFLGGLHVGQRHG